MAGGEGATAVTYASLILLVAIEQSSPPEFARGVRRADVPTNT